jgi:hypothetical protein
MGQDVDMQAVAQYRGDGENVLADKRDVLRNAKRWNTPPCLAV